MKLLIMSLGDLFAWQREIAAPASEAFIPVGVTVRHGELSARRSSYSSIVVVAKSAVVRWAATA